MTLNLHLLRIFAAVVEHGGFSRAAGVLRISQPAVSRAVASLERDVGTALLDRIPRGIRLTEAGEVMVAHARAIFGAERAALEELDALRGLERASLHIGASTTIATYLLPALLAEFHRRHPAVALRVTSANTLDVATRLIERAIDIALVEGPVHDERVHVSPWRTDELVIVVGRDHPLLAAPPASAAALSRELFIVREPGSGTREVAEDALRRHRVVPRTTLEMSSTEAIKQTVAAGLGVSILSAAAAADQLALGKLRRLDIPGFHVPRALSRLSLADRRPSFAARAFAALLDERPPSATAARPETRPKRSPARPGSARR